MGKESDRKHDETYRSLFMHVELIEELLRRFADTAAWIDDIDFDKARTLPTEFISDRLVERRSDLIWELPTHGGKTLYVAILIEFQSSPQAPTQHGWCWDGHAHARLRGVVLRSPADHSKTRQSRWAPTLLLNTSTLASYPSPPSTLTSPTTCPWWPTIRYGCPLIAHDTQHG